MLTDTFDERSMFSIEETNEMLEIARRRTQISILSGEIALAHGMNNPAEAERLGCILETLEDNTDKPDPVDIPRQDLNYERRDYTWK